MAYFTEDGKTCPYHCDCLGRGCQTCCFDNDHPICIYELTEDLQVMDPAHPHKLNV